MESIHKSSAESPQVRRERTLEKRNNWMLFFIILQFVVMAIMAVVFIYRPQAPIVIDHETGQVIGDYRTSEFRTQEEMINGGIRFVDHLLSLNSTTIRRDQFIAIGMMTDALREARIEYLKSSNLIIKIETAKSTSHLQYDKNEVIFAKGNKMRVEYIGKIILTDLKKSSVPFHIIVDLVNAPITKNNTSGVRVEAFSDF